MTASRIVAFTKDWDDVPTCTTHVLREMGTRMPVLWVSSIGTRRPQLGAGKDARRLIDRLRRAFRRAEAKEHNLRVLWPLLFPRAERNAVVRVNRFLMKQYERREWDWMGSGPVEYWCFVPNAVDLLPGRQRAERGNLKPEKFGADGIPSGLRSQVSGLTPHPSSLSRVIYYCVDDWTLFHNLDGEWLGKKEDELLKRADVVFSPAAYLVEKCRRAGATNVHHVPHGVEYSKFVTALEDATPIPEDIRALPHPVIGFYGNIHPWIDFGLVDELAGRCPEWTFVLIGQVYCDISRFDRLPNVHFLGRREHDELPGYCKAFDAAFIPYDAGNPRMESVNPVKTQELLAAGVPVVATDIPELRRFGDRVLLCRSLDEWVAALKKQIVRTDRVAISRSVAGDDWSERVQQIRQIVGCC